MAVQIAVALAVVSFLGTWEVTGPGAAVPESDATAGLSSLNSSDGSSVPTI